MTTATTTDKPFLSTSSLPAWAELTPEAALGDIRQALRDADIAINAITDLPEDKLSYDSVFVALESSMEAVNRGFGRLMHLDSVRDSEPQRDVIEALLPEVVTFTASIPLNAKLWETLKKTADLIEQDPDKHPLSPIQKRFIEETLTDFRESGADLSDPLKKRVAEINNELALLTKTYGERVLDSTNAWELVITDEKLLKGLPESAIQAAFESAKAKGKATDEIPAWRFSQHQPSMFPVMQYADNEDLRRQVWEGSVSIGAGDFDTSDLIPKILKLRDEKAKLLGFATHADLTTKRRMAGTGQKALSFIEDLHKRVVDVYRKEMDTLARYKAKHSTSATPSGDEKTPIASENDSTTSTDTPSSSETTPPSKSSVPADKLAPWDLFYWSERQRKDLYDFNGELLRPYYAVDQVMKGLFDITSTLFDITVTEKPSFYRESPDKPVIEGAVEVWHPDVKFYEIRDKSSGEHLGSFYADWYPRETKRGGAWMNQLEVGQPPVGDQPRTPHLGLIAGNMTKPVGNKPALLTHEEVETIFHEFGHLLHLILSDVPVKSFAGTNVAWDFVELPSQIMENWCWNRDALNQFALHYESGETIPDELFTKMKNARTYQSGLAFMRQLSFAKIDLELHLHTDRYLGKDLDSVDDEILAEYRYPLAVRPPTMLRRFNHVFSDPIGYSAGYYSYKWAEVLDADAFTRFEKEGILNPQTGREFRKSILSQGNSRPAAELYRDFMGRDPKLEPLLIRSNIPLPSEK